jgi:hypothetical protein
MGCSEIDVDIVDYIHQNQDKDHWQGSENFEKKPSGSLKGSTEVFVDQLCILLASQEGLYSVELVLLLLWFNLQYSDHVCLHLSLSFVYIQ